MLLILMRRVRRLLTVPRLARVAFTRHPATEIRGIRVLVLNKAARAADAYLAGLDEEPGEDPLGALLSG
jgi:hypothetical protein